MTNDGGQTNYVDVLVISADLSLAKAVQSACQTVQAENPDKSYRIFPGINKEKIVESLEKHVFHSILVDREMITDKTPEQYVTELTALVRKRPENADAAIVLISSECDGEQARALVRAGWKDVLIKPLDRALFLQKMSLYNPKTPFLKEALLFNMGLDKNVDVAFSYKASELSEYGMTVSSKREIALGTVVGVSAPFLDAPFSAVVISCSPVGKEDFTVQFMFIGISPAETQAIRKLIKKEYAEEKQAA